MRAPEGLQLPLSLEQGGGSCRRGEPSWGMEGGEEQRTEKAAEPGRQKARGRGPSETTLPRLSPATREQVGANPGARWNHWPADDTPFLFAGGWAVTQGGSQWERRRWLHQLMLKKTRGSCLYSHPFGPLHLRQLLHPHFKMPRTFGSTDPPSSVTWHQVHQPIWILEGTQSMTQLFPPPPATTPLLLLRLH